MTEILHDPRWFPIDVDLRSGEVVFAFIEHADIVAAPFLDSRFELPSPIVKRLPLQSVSDCMPIGRRSIGWIWHTSFCGSTLLARALNIAPKATALKEPLIIRRLADAKHSGVAIDMHTGWLRALLSRPWHDAGHILIKPTHAALNVADELTRVGDRCILIHTSLEDFLVSNLKKSRETLAKVPVLVERAMGASKLHLRLPRDAFEPPTPLCAVALQWAAQMEIMDSIAQHYGNQALMIDGRKVMGALQDAAAAASAHLQLGHSSSILRQHVSQIAGMHAKASHQEFSEKDRKQEDEAIRVRHRAALDETICWAEQHVLPAMSKSSKH